ncbi:hypothetical protein [Sphaerisporangium corydalis]|uniref:Band 7 domain-containing protein n=1 Tax=Sphaerisporangium corydalis TaxID=1441875 RepID=A0ABV9ENI7_9ACTN|nr:hypothetical protein [Sphaerisporangium corydalis]
MNAQHPLPPGGPVPPGHSSNVNQPLPKRPDPPLNPVQRQRFRQVVDDNWTKYAPPQVPLILVEQSVATAGRLPIQPGRALLYSDDTGEVFHLQKPPRVFAMRRYRWRYEVDLSDHYTSFHLEVPSRSKAARFRLTIDVGWRVTHPAQIVRARIRDGNAIVQSWVTEAVLPISRSYEIEQDGELEQHLTESLGHGRVHDYPGGISMFRFSARADHDRGAAERIAAVVEARHEADLAEAGLSRLKGRIHTEEDLILMLLQRAPDQVGDVITDIRKRREMSMQNRIDLFNKMVDNDLIQEAEMETIRQLIIQPIAGIVGSTPTGTFGIQQLAPPEKPQAISRHRADSGDDEEDVLPSQVTDGSVDHVTGWNPTPWQRGQGEEDL